MSTAADIDSVVVVHEATRWSDDGWTAQVIKNEEDDGWAVAMTRDGESDPALVGPWTMGRDKKNPKPLDAPSFHTLVKTASEVIRRHEQQLQARLHQQVEVDTEAGRLRVSLQITPDDDHPSAVLTAWDDGGQVVGRSAADPGFKLTRGSASDWVESGYRRPGRG